MEKIDGQSKDLVKDNFEKLKELFPQCVKDNVIDIEQLLLLLGSDHQPEKEIYNMTWSGKTEATKLAQKSSTGTLRPCKEESENWDNTQNLYIEGDNLEVLRLLQKSYENRIKMIYIDPPYNTGHDFVYKDNFADNIANYKEVTGQALKTNAETDGRFHSNWLNMIYPRLKLARNLLTNDGVIFISIDDNEQANLKKVCDEIFGEQNFITQLPRVTKKGGKSSEIIAKNHDYLLVYQKSSQCTLYPIEHNDEGFKNKDEYFETRGYYKLNQTLDYDSLQYSKSLDYPITIDEKTIYPGGSYDAYLERQKGNHNNADWAWRWSKEKYEFGLRNGFIVLKNSRNGCRIYTKTYQNASIVENNGTYEIEYKERTKSMSTLDLCNNEYSNDNATKDLDEILDKKLFNFPKPLSLIKLLLKLSSKENDIILDFFSGSATTAHAILEQNILDGQNRKFIMVQIPEQCEETSEAFRAGFKNICEIGKERIRRAGEKIKQDNPDTDIDIGFKVFKLDSSNLKKWNNTPTKDIEEIKNRIKQISMDYLEDGRTDLDLTYEIMLKYGINLTSSVKKTRNEKAYIIKNEDYSLLICSTPNLTENDIKGLVEEDAGTYMFADRCFTDDNLLVNAEELLKAKNKKILQF